MPTRPGKRLKAESRLFTTRGVIRSLSRKNFSNLDLQIGNLNVQLENLEQLVRKYTTPVNDEYPVLSEADIIELSKAYSQSIAQCEHLLSFRDSDELKDNISYNAMLKMAESTRKFLTSDLRALAALNAKFGATLPEALENARTVVVNVEDLNVEVAKGGIMSSRIPISITSKSGHKIDGMFTKTTSYDFVGKSNAIFQKLIDMSSSDQAKQFWRDQMLSDEDVNTDSMALRTKFSFYNVLANQPGQFGEAITELMNANDLNIDAFSQQEIQEIKKYLASIQDDAFKLANEYAMNTYSLQIESGANIDKRNTAMSIVANLFGRSDLLANSVSMTIEADGVKQTGTFMEFVKGASDVSHLKPNDPFFDCNISQGIDGRPVLKDMADLQVIDYICGNIDRHTGNMLYIHDVDKNGNTYLKGIKAIDNDSSFGLSDLKQGLAKLSDVAGMKVISESMANLVSKITPASLQLVLKGSGLSDNAINRATERLGHIKGAIDKGDLRVIKDEKWKDIKLNSLTKSDNQIERHGFGVFSLIALQYDDLRHADARREMEQRQPNGDLRLANGEMKDDGNGFALNEAQQIKAKDGIDKVVQELTAVKDVWFGSKQFSKMLASAKTMQNELAMWKEQSKEAGAPTWDAKKFEKMAKDLREKTEQYLERKYMQSASKANRNNSIKRILAANSAMDFTHRFLDKVDLSVWDEYRQNNAEYNMAEFSKIRNAQNNLGNKQKDMNPINQTQQRYIN